MTFERENCHLGKVFGLVVMYGPSKFWPEHQHLRIRFSFFRVHYELSFDPSKKQFEA
jgi:hypothetical protein